MSNEVISCPLSACFIGMSPAQASAAQALKWSNVRGERFDIAAATAAYGALAEPAETGDREPTFLDRMLRRVGRSPLSRVGAETAASKLIDTLHGAGALNRADVTLTTAREEEFHGQLDPAALLAIRTAFSNPSFDSLGCEARVALVQNALDSRALTPDRALDTKWANLTLPGLSSIYLPVEMTRVVHGVPHAIGSIFGLMREIEAARDAIGVPSDTSLHTSHAATSIDNLFSLLSEAARFAEARHRVLVLSL